jgi:hypothetical protein
MRILVFDGFPGLNPEVSILSLSKNRASLSQFHESNRIKEITLSEVPK